jgi:opacity protein-like surface antigen
MKGADMRKLTLALLVLGMALPSARAQQPGGPVGAAGPAATGREVLPFSMMLARAGVFLATDSAYKDIYGDTPVYGLELRIGKEKLAGWLEGSYRSDTGASSFTKEETKVSVIGLEAGALYRFMTGAFSPYVGAGAGYYSFKESNSFIGQASKGGMGFCVLGGASYLAGSLIVLDCRIKYSSCRMKPADFDINIGGLTISLGIGFRI